MPNRRTSTAFRAVLIVVVVAIFLLRPSGLVDSGACWRAPVEAPVSDPFRLPSCRWCPGNRGIEYDTRGGAAVLAVASGRVSFVGSVVGTPFVIVRHFGGRRVTYGNVSDSRFKVGDLVVRGTQVGSTTGRLHFGLREGDRYIDPTPYLGRLVYSPRLIPSNGDRPAAARPPQLRCQG